MSASVYSIHNGNLSPKVLELQKAVVEKFLPAGWTFTQFYQPLGGEPHAEGMKACLEICPTDVIIFLDTDCIPLTSDSFPALFRSASTGTLVGNVQRSNHIQNNEHIFIAPSCMAFSRSQYLSLNSPSFHTTQRGDIGEELTYAWHAAGLTTVGFLPTQSRNQIWALETGERGYGHGTVFGDKFYHEFQIRTGGALEQSFINKCKQILGI
jgi:hypothetical protein